MSATVSIGAKERDTLHWLMARRLFILGQDPPELALSEGVTLDELGAEFSEDLRLMVDIGFEVEDDREAVDLTMPVTSLVKTIRRLRRDARRAPTEPPREHEQGDDAGCWQRFREAVDVCDEVLELLDSPSRNGAAEVGAAECSATGVAFELSPVSPPAIIILAAVERAARHERSDEVSTATVVEHLGFESTPQTNRLLHLRLDGLRDAGSLTRVGRGGADTWLLTSEGREELNRLYEAEEVGELPEAPQHRAWREARVEAAVRLERFKLEMAEMLEEATALLDQPHPPHSSEWIAMSQRLSPAAWRVGSATHCLYEWVEPDDDFPDVDEAPGPRPGRRAISAWDQASESGGSA
ncbi:MAG TPA: hypothetical protein VH275_04910 [Solirubrobacterales bacterium]|jgi:hypothetical protein|nr:hypothetical protein [Solirubrobacterales bacterium]